MLLTGNAAALTLTLTTFDPFRFTRPAVVLVCLLSTAVAVVGVVVVMTEKEEEEGEEELEVEAAATAAAADNKAAVEGSDVGGAAIGASPVVGVSPVDGAMENVCANAARNSLGAIVSAT